MDAISQWFTAQSPMLWILIGLGLVLTLIWVPEVRQARKENRKRRRL